MRTAYPTATFMYNLYSRLSVTMEFYSPQEYEHVRDVLLQETIRKRPDTDPELTAYTPTETLDLMENNETIGAYFEHLESYRIPEVKTLVGIPCAAAKPWTRDVQDGRASQYGAVWEVKDDVKDAYFVTVSEPLGIVPEDHWDLQVDGIGSVFYDVPGLFSALPQFRCSREDFERKYGFEKKRVPFDRDDYKRCVEILGHEIAVFLSNNADRYERAEFFVKKGSTHDAFMKEALAQLDDDLQERVNVNYLPKGYIKPGNPGGKAFQEELLALSGDEDS